MACNVDLFVKIYVYDSQELGKLWVMNQARFNRRTLSICKTWRPRGTFGTFHLTIQYVYIREIETPTPLRNHLHHCNY